MFTLSFQKNWLYTAVHSSSEREKVHSRNIYKWHMYIVSDFDRMPNELLHHYQANKLLYSFYSILKYISNNIFREIKFPKKLCVIWNIFLKPLSLLLKFEAIGWIQMLAIRLTRWAIIHYPIHLSLLCVVWKFSRSEMWSENCTGDSFWQWTLNAICTQCVRIEKRMK